LENCFESHHRVLDAFIDKLIGFRPSDAGDIMENHYQGPEKLSDFNFSRCRAGMEHPTSCDGSFECRCLPDDYLTHLVATSVFEYIFTGQPRSFGGSEGAAMVENGFATFQETETGVVDEPLALLAAANFFAKQTSWSLETILSAFLSKHPPAIVDIKKLASTLADIMSSLTSFVTRQARQRQAVANSTKRKAGLKAVGPADDKSQATQVMSLSFDVRMIICHVSYH
jgi:hypothetical protein